MWILAFIIGLSVGSFLNVVISRLPQSLAGKPINLNHPKRSFCPNCHSTLGVLELIPVFSFLFQRAQCRHCAQKIPWIYPLVELITALLSVWLVWHFGVNMQTPFYGLLLFFLVPLFMIDIKHQLLPDSLTLPLIWLGFIFQILFGDLQSAVIGAMAGYLTLWVLYWGFKLVSGKEGMGYGDFKLSAAIGAWLGWQLLPTVFLIAPVLGLVFFIIKRNTQQVIAFGPFLIVAFALLLEGERGSLAQQFLALFS
jgi:leader peptidase (prepilin peptidase)/N-methyltransferase